MSRFTRFFRVNFPNPGTVSRLCYFVMIIILIMLVVSKAVRRSRRRIAASKGMGGLVRERPRIFVRSWWVGGAAHKTFTRSGREGVAALQTSDTLSPCSSASLFSHHHYHHHRDYYHYHNQSSSLSSSLISLKLEIGIEGYQLRHIYTIHTIYTIQVVMMWRLKNTKYRWKLWCVTT